MVETTPSPSSTKVVRSASGKDVRLDNQGFLVNFDDWDEEVAQALAREEGVEELTEGQWAVIRFFREFYLNYGKAPLNHKLKVGTGMSIMELEAMFPNGIKNSAWRWAGLRNPQGCR